MTGMLERYKTDNLIPCPLVKILEWTENKFICITFQCLCLIFMEENPQPAGY